MHRILILLAITLSTLSTLTATAHPGKTDANGWHTDSKTGMRHQHPKPDAEKPEPKKPAVKKPEPKKPAAKTPAPKAPATKKK